MADWTDDELMQVVEEVLRRSRIDPEFRELAVRDTKSAVATITPRQLPGEFGIQFHDNSGSTKHIVLPDPIVGIEELSEEDLKAAAGGQINIMWGR
jgi:hypothetical protein